jgi:hypothetical protein
LEGLSRGLLEEDAAFSGIFSGAEDFFSLFL